MRILVAAVGRLGAKGSPEGDLVTRYAKRISYPLKFKEVAEERGRTVAERRAREGARLAAAIPDDARVVALDATGRALSSEEFARTLGAWRDSGTRDIAFLIGAADGLDPGVREGADLVLSLGPMTWPHLLVRGMLAEQIYRAQCILAGHPYHRA